MIGLLISIHTSSVKRKKWDGTRIPQCKGVMVFGTTLHECEDELHSILEDWILLGLKLNHPLPVIAGIDLNQEPAYEPMEAM